MINTYFLGGTSAVGFQTKFNFIIDQPHYFTYILKGGPGTGKSTLMKKVAKHFSQDDLDLYYCSSDINSLDAVVIREKKAIIVDGTAPHVFNANYPGISQVLVDLGAYWDRKKLSVRETEIRRCVSVNAAYHRRARAFVTALSSVNDSIYTQAFDALNQEELDEVIEDLLSYIPSEERPGSCIYNQLSAITSEGYFTQETSSKFSVFGILDPQYAAGCQILNRLKNILIKEGQDIIVSECILFGKSQVEHITIPKHNLRISLLNRLNKLDDKVCVDCNDFYTAIAQDEIDNALTIIGSLEQESAYSIKKALAIHDDLESYYIGALDFKKLDRVTEELIQDIESIGKRR